MRLGNSAYEASLAALSLRKYRSLCEARLNLLPLSILSELRTCVDAGAHAGNWTQALLDRFKPERVLAVECEPRLVGPLRERFSASPVVAYSMPHSQRAKAWRHSISCGIRRARRC